ncbi:MAG: ABC transporter ATP-binding protein [Alphaproteobacteria bacterium]
MTFSQVLPASARLGLGWGTIAAILALHLVATLFEGAGLGILLPVFQFVQAHGDIAALTADSALWRKVVDVYAALGLSVTLPVLLVTSFVCILVRQVLIYTRLVFAARTRYDLVRGIRQQGFDRFLRARLGYSEREAQGGVVNDLTTACDLAVNAPFSLLSFLGVGAMFAVYLAMLLALSFWMTVLAVGVLGLGVLVLRGLLTKSKLAGAGIAVANRALSDHLVERLKTLRLIRLAGTEGAESAAMERLTGHQRDQFLARDMRRAEVAVLIEPFVVAVCLLFLYFGVTRFNASLEEIGLFMVVIVRLAPVVSDAMLNYQSVLTTAPSLEAVVARLQGLEAAREEASGARRLAGLERAIRFESVTFAYEGADSPAALRGLSLDIPARSTTAIVGPSGAGKSTLVDLLPRLRIPQSGRVLMDGVPLQDFALQSLRAAISYAPQTPQVFEGTVAHHIRYGNPAATMEEVREAATLAGADDFIMALPQGYDATVGEGGVRLSGGQRQRLDLARALVRRAPILILDEPTSQLDADAEEAFRDALLRIRASGKFTIILIGHRLSTVAVADRIVVLQAGRVAEAGSHAELVARGGWYAQALGKQRGPSSADARAEAMKTATGAK